MIWRDIICPIFTIFCNENQKSHNPMESYGKNQVLITVLIATLQLSNLCLKAQDEKNEAKLMNLQAKIEMAEAKVAVAEQKMAIADSLLTTGEINLEEAEERFAVIDEEQRNREKEFNAEYKRIKKLTRSKDQETAEKAEDDLVILEREYNADEKAYNNEVKLLTRKASRAESDMAKGKEKKRDAEDRLKAAQESLENAQANYEVFMDSLEDE